MEEPLSCRLLDVCIVVGVPEKVLHTIKTQQQVSTSLYRRELTSSVLMVLSPPFCTSCALVQDTELEKEGRTLQDGNPEGQNNGESPQGTTAELEDDVAELQVSMAQVLRPSSYFTKMEGKGTDSSSGNSKNSIASELRGSLNSTRKSCSIESVGGWNPDQNSTSWSLDFDGLPQLCMPDGTHLSPIRPCASVHTLVLTDVAGEKSYAVVLTFHRPLVYDQLRPDGSQMSLEGQQNYAFLPTCICLLSKAPYYTALKDCLSCLQQELEEHDYEMDDNGKFEEVVREFAARLSLVPIPPPGPLHLCLKMGHLDILLPSASGPNEPIIDFDLHIPFLCLKPADLLMVIVSLLTEQHLVLLSNTCALLTPVAEALLASLHPLIWRQTYVPLLSEGMLDFLEAPTVFLMGCLRCHIPEIFKVKGLVIVDLDTGVVSSPIDEDPVPYPPEAATQEFLLGARDLRLSEEVAALGIPTPANLVAERKWRHTRRSHLNEYLKKLYFNFLLSTFRDVTDHLNYEHRVFNSDEFLRTRQPQELQFYKKLLTTDMFHCFLRDRLERTVDAFSCIDRRSTVLMTSPRSDPHHNTSFRHSYSDDGMFSKLMTQDSADPHSSSRSLLFGPTSLDGESDKGRTTPILLDWATDSKGLDPSVHTICLPLLPKNPFAVQELEVYVNELSSTLSETLNSAPSQACGLRAACLYLRGCLLLARGSFHDALEDFHSISKTDSSVLPAEQARQLLSHLPSDLLEQIRKDPKLRWLMSDVGPFGLEPLPPTPEVDSFKRFSFPSQPLDSEAFSKSMQQVGIITNGGDCHRLFKILAKGRQPFVSAKMFQDFYEAWHKVEHAVQELMPKLASVLYSGEQVHCLSANIRTNQGDGQLLVTNKRLLLFTEVMVDCLEIACFADIQAVEQVQSYLKPMRGLCVSTRNKPKFVANLKADSNLWYFTVMEMWTGMIMANTFKDNHYVVQAISHILQMAAVAHCLPAKKATAAAASLAHFTSTMKQGPVAVSMSTYKSLYHQLSPASGLEGMHSVDAMIYIPDEEPIGATCSLRKNTSGSGRLWCALSWGRLVAYNTQSWSNEKLCVQAGNRRVNCLLTVGNKQMWAGSSDCNIYIVDTANFVCNKMLTGHSGEVTGLELMSDLFPRMVISCSMNGQIFRWDLEKLEPLTQFQIPDCHTLTSMRLNEHLLWCCVERQVLVLEIDGCELQRFCLHDGSCYVLMNSVLLLPEKNQLLAACRNRAEIMVWNTLCPESPPKTICLSQAPGVSCMLSHAGQLWVGVKAGGATFSHLFVLDTDLLIVRRMLLAEPGTVKCLCHTDEGFVLSATGRDRPKVAVWRVELSLCSISQL